MAQEEWVDFRRVDGQGSTDEPRLGPTSPYLPYPTTSPSPARSPSPLSLCSFLAPFRALLAMVLRSAPPRWIGASLCAKAAPVHQHDDDSYFTCTPQGRQAIRSGQKKGGGEEEGGEGHHRPHRPSRPPSRLPRNRNPPRRPPPRCTPPPRQWPEPQSPPWAGRP